MAKAARMAGRVEAGMGMVKVEPAPVLEGPATAAATQTAVAMATATAVATETATATAVATETATETAVAMATLVFEIRFQEIKKKELLTTKIDPNQTEHLGKWLE